MTFYDLLWALIEWVIAAVVRSRQLYMLLTWAEWQMMGVVKVDRREKEMKWKKRRKRKSTNPSVTHGPWLIVNDDKIIELRFDRTCNGVCCLLCLCTLHALVLWIRSNSCVLSSFNTPPIASSPSPYACLLVSDVDIVSSSPSSSVPHRFVDHAVVFNWWWWLYSRSGAIIQRQVTSKKEKSRWTRRDWIVKQETYCLQQS